MRSPCHAVGLLVFIYCIVMVDDVYVGLFLHSSLHCPANSGKQEACSPEKVPVGVRLHSLLLKTLADLYWLLSVSVAPTSKSPGDPIPNTQPPSLPTG